MNYQVRGSTKKKGFKQVKLIMAAIKPFKLEKGREPLTPIGVDRLTINEVTVFVCQTGQVEIYRGAKYMLNFLPKVKIEIAVDDDVAEQVVAATTKAA